MPSTKKNMANPTPQKAVLGQVIACVVALGIMGFGAWSLLGLKAPYHPDAYDGEVTRGASDLSGVNANN